MRAQGGLLSTAWMLQTVSGTPPHTRFGLVAGSVFDTADRHAAGAVFGFIVYYRAIIGDVLGPP